MQQQTRGFNGACAQKHRATDLTNIFILVPVDDACYATLRILLEIMDETLFANFRAGPHGQREICDIHT